MNRFDNLPGPRILIYGDSNTYGYNPENDGRYGDEERFGRVLAEARGCTVLEEGLPGRTAAFEDPMLEGFCGIRTLFPVLMSHAPLDLLIVMLGTNDCKAQFASSAEEIAENILLLAKKAAGLDCWRSRPDILIVCPPPIDPAYGQRMFAEVMGPGCDVRARALSGQLEVRAKAAGFRFLDAGKIPGCCMHPLDGMHLTPQAHRALGLALAEY